MNYLSKVINDHAVGKDQQLHAYIFFIIKHAFFSTYKMR